MRNLKMQFMGLSLVCLAFVSLVLLSPDARGASQKPVKTVVNDTDFIEPPPQLASAFSEASAVALVRVVSRSSGVRTRPGYPDEIVTEYSVQVERVFKSAPKTIIAGSSDKVMVLGGDADRGDHIERQVQKRFPHLKNNARYVLFLRYVDSFGGWMVKWGPHGVYELDNKVVQTPGWSALSEYLARMTPEQLLSALGQL